MEALIRARDQLAADDPNGYESLRAAWRECRCAEIAEQLERIGRACGRAPVTGKTVKAWYAAWVARAREGDPLDITNQLEDLITHAQPRNASMVATCLAELAVHEDDPQLTKPLLALLEVPAQSSSWNKVHTNIFKLLEASGDPRVIKGLVPAIRRATKDVPESMRDQAREERTRARVAKRFPEGVPALPRGAKALVAAIAKLSPERSEAARAKPANELDTLLAAILEDPTDPARRTVYADALIEAGDPRGEIITLQQSDRPEAAAKAARLIEKHRKTLLGSIAKTVIASTAVFEAGFLAACETDVRRKVEADAVFGRPEWATVRRLGFRSYGMLTPVMRALEEAYGVIDTALEPIKTITLPRLRILGIGNASRGGFGDGFADGQPGPSADGLRALITAAAVKNLPALEEIHLDHSSSEFRGGNSVVRTAVDYRWLLDSPIGKRLQGIGISYHRNLAERLPSWIAELRASKTLERLVIFWNEIDVVVEKRAQRFEVAMRESFEARMSPKPVEAIETRTRQLNEFKDSLGALF